VSPDHSHAMNHVVLVLFENRSFDNMLGRLYGPEDGKRFEGVVGKDLSNPIPGVGRARSGAEGGPVHRGHRPGFAEPGLG